MNIHYTTVRGGLCKFDPRTKIILLAITVIAATMAPSLPACMGIGVVYRIVWMYLRENQAFFIPSDFFCPLLYANPICTFP